ncbi:hypothetical protein SELMODRAFT_103577 [Selaginella moellendorffii]|uniref:Pentacotripeptide-repeat region of PRORP domain-containing protein n=1 Tax=Selaginella moellendorffii TaxID=88036 RepID=D8RXK6_SELML|nr:hypothetical protein SELMODRAFT_103577 [Selaginella moellendorffii]
MALAAPPAPPPPLPPQLDELDSAALGNLLRQCAADRALAAGKLLHAHILKNTIRFHRQPYLYNLLVQMYAKCGCLEDAVAVFDLIQPKNNHSWNILMAAFALNGHPREALDIFHRVGAAMDGDAGKIAIVNALGALHSRSPEELEAGREIHGRIVAKELQGDGVVATALLSMYGRCGEGIDDAWSVFDAIQRHPDQDHRSVVPWNAMLAALAQRGYGGDVVALFRRMDGVKPSEGTFASIVAAIASTGSADQLGFARSFHARIVDASFQVGTSPVGNALIHMYGKCGSAEDAQAVFDAMEIRSVNCWTALIEAYAQLGRGSQALQWFQAMRREGICPDPIAFVGILFACSHSGLLRDARYYFLSMIEDHGMQPIAEHYECMVDLLGRTGQLQRAQELIEIMPFYPKPLAWMSLLGASSVQSSDEHAGDAAEHVLGMEPRNSSSYIALSTAISSSSSSPAQEP